MITLIIPCAGESKLDGKPACIARHPDGKYLFEKCISGLNLENVGRIVITILESDNLKYDIDRKIKKSFAGKFDNVEIYHLPEKTSGPADTVYLTLTNMKISGAFVIKDTDNFISVPKLSEENFVVGLDVFDYDIRNLRTKSFITLNEQNNILDVTEKQITSNNICAGLYGFKSAKDFVAAYDVLKDPNYEIKKLYVSHIIAYMTGRYTEIFHYIKAENFESYNSREDWDEVKRNCRTKKERLALFDMDGTLFDTNEVNFFAYKEALKKFGVDFKRDYWYKNCIGVNYKNFLAPLGITDEKILSEIHEVKKTLYEKNLFRAKENTRLFEIIEQIRPVYNIALVTTASKKNVGEILKTFGRFEVFDKIFTQEDFKNLKPDPECYFKAMEYFGTKPEHTIIFEDSESGLKAAETSGAFYYKTFGFNDTSPTK